MGQLSGGAAQWGTPSIRKVESKHSCISEDNSVFPNLLQMLHSVRRLCHKCVCSVWWFPCFVLGMAGTLAQTEEKHFYGEITF